MCTCPMAAYKYYFQVIRASACARHQAEPHLTRDVAARSEWAGRRLPTKDDADATAPAMSDLIGDS